MSGVRVLVGTRKGAFILTADGARKRWKVSGPHFAGWEIYHVKGSPVDPNRIMPRKPAGGSVKSFNARMMVEKPGTSRERLPENRLPQDLRKQQATSLFTTQPRSR